MNQAARNATNDMWLKTGGINCAYYVIVGNNLIDQQATFTFYRTSAVKIGVLMVVMVSSLISLMLLI